jgi:hypothetical protein
VKAANAVFIALGTPSRRGDGHADLSFVYDAAREIASAIEDRYLKTEAMIDARIAKIMARLVGLKEYKKIYGQKPIEALTVRRGPDHFADGRAVRDTDEQAAPTASAIKKRRLCNHYLWLYFSETTRQATAAVTRSLPLTGQGRWYDLAGGIAAGCNRHSLRQPNLRRRAITQKEDVR